MTRRPKAFPGLILSTVMGLVLLQCDATPRKHPLVKRAEGGDVQAMYLVGMAHLSISGEGIVKRGERREPVYWLRMAAQNHHSGAMYILADLPIPNEEKVMWLKKGAELGSEACIIELMNAHRFGTYGLPKDPGASIFWELKRGELYLKRDQKSPQETQETLAKWEQRYRKENNYGGPIRPLP